MDAVAPSTWPHASSVALTVGLTVVWLLVVTFGLHWLLNRLGDWWDRCHGRRPPHEEIAASRRQAELRHQIWQMEQQIREEQLSDEERAWRREYRERQAAIRREARRRLGLPEEEMDENGLL